MRILLFLIFFAFMPCVPYATDSVSLSQPVDDCAALYEELGLSAHMDFAVFRRAYTGYNLIEDRTRNVLTIVDFTKPSTDKRIYVIDMDKHKLLHWTWVAHGQGSGANYATSFSNISGSHKSSLGFYLTDRTYIGGNGYSLLLEGLERGINDKARERAIVMHGADYCDPARIPAAGRLGRSFGCPALPHAVNTQVIDAIKNGSVLYIHAEDPEYKRLSQLVPFPVDSRSVLAENIR